jgi:hypothetical protein
MRRRWWSVLGLLVLGSGCSPSSGDPPDGASAMDLSSECARAEVVVPAGYPPLGGNCRLHVELIRSPDAPADLLRSNVLDQPTDEAYASSLGLLEVPESFPGAPRAGHTLEVENQNPLGSGFMILLPSLEPGVYVPIDGTSMSDGLGFEIYSSSARYGTATVRVDGREGDAVWGRFLGRLCTNLSYCEYVHGRFAGVLGTEPSPVNAIGGGEDPSFYDQYPWPLCFEDAVRCFPSQCTEWVCIDHRCQEGTNPPLTCAPDETCDRFIGCVP